MTSKTADPPPTTTAVLIPEARQHRRQRYLKTVVLAAACVLIVAGLIVALVVFFGGPTADGKARPFTAAAGTNSDSFAIRPVLCVAPPYAPAVTPAPPAGLTCATTMTAYNLGIQSNSSPAGYVSNNVPPDMALAGVPSTRASAEEASSTVLLPGLNHGLAARLAQRYVLGPIEMTSRSISSTVVRHSPSGQWLVDYTTTSGGSLVWDKVAEENFHQFLAFEANGIVYSAPVVQPTQSSFSSFGGRGEISGGLTRVDAVRLAHAMNDRR
jgi:SecDF, P1 head subdomain